MNWILCGFKGAGKSYFAAKLGLPFLDTDTLIEEALSMPIPQIVKEKGEPFFRKQEQITIEALDVEGHVIAVGGGALLNPASTAALKRLGLLIFLNAPKTLIKQRLLTPPLPSYLDPSDPEGSFETMWSTRISEYERICDTALELESKSDERILEELWQVINLATSFASRRGENLTEKPSEW